MVRLFGTWGEQMIRLARGEDDRDVDPCGLAQSIGAEETYEDDLVDVDAIRQDAPRALEPRGPPADPQRPERADRGREGQVLRLQDPHAAARPCPSRCRTRTRSTGRPSGLLARVPLESRRVRLTGVSVSGIEPGGPPLTLIPDAESDKRRRVEEVAARISQRFGDERTVTRATLLEEQA